MSRVRGGPATASSAAAAASSSDGSTAGPPPKWLGKRIGRFRLIGAIGKGAMGRVFRAEDVQLHRLAALKVISCHSSRGRSAAQRQEQFLLEARSAAKLEHPNIVGVYEVSSTADVHFIAMELVEGGNLKDLVTAAGPLDVPRACQLAADAADALQHAHEQGIVHRDVKPANLMLTRSGRCKLGDFGLACPVAETGGAGAPSPSGGAPGSAVGTPHYVAPEVVLGEEATPLSDVYSLGATLFYLLTGVTPFPGDDPTDVLRHQVEALPPDVRTLRPEIPEALALTVWRALAKQPTARFDSAGHFAGALRLHTIPVDGGATDALPAADHGPVAGRLPFRFDRRAALVALLGGGAAVAMLVFLTVLLTRGDGRNAAAAARARAAPTPPAAAADHVARRAEVPLPLPGQVISATDSPVLLRVAGEADPARHNGVVTVEGWVSRIDPRPADGDHLLRFRGVDRKRGAACSLSPPVLAALAARHGDPAGRRVRVSGRVELSDGQPVVTPASAEQIALIP